MSDSKLDGSNPEQTSNPNVDDLLAEVQKMADQVESLIDPDRRDKPNPPGSAAAAETPEAPAATGPTPLADPSPVQPEPDAIPATPAADIPLDQSAQALAEEEIGQVLDRIQKKETEATPEQIAAEAEAARALQVQAMPSVARKLRSLLFAIDGPFTWVPTQVKTVLGYVGLLILAATVALWITVLCFIKK